MIPGVDSIYVNGVSFAMLASGVILFGWWGGPGKFLKGLVVANAVLLASWLAFLDFVALAGFVVPPYLVIRHLWGRPDRAAAPLMAAIITWEVALFAVLRKYEWIGTFTWLDHPIAIVGISYLLFRIIHLIVQAPELGHLPFSSIRFLAYGFAFWTLLSGPIQRYEDFCRGLDDIGRPPLGECLQSGHRAVNGLFKAFLIAPVFLETSDIALITAPGAGWLDFAIVFYSFPIYLYLNFSGYTDVMIGAAGLAGMRTLPENFNRPYFARNVQDFWGRWHMSFSTWIRYYVFQPLSKWLISRGGRNNEAAMMAGAVIVTFLAVGAWHGTTINFLVLGLLHGIAIVVTASYGSILKRVLGRRRRKAFLHHPLVHGLSVVLCFHFVCATLMLFPHSPEDIVAALFAFLSIS